MPPLSYSDKERLMMKRILTIFIMTAIPSSIAFAGPYYCYNPLFPGGGIFMWFTTVALFALVIYLVYKSASKSNSLLTADSPDAMSILKARLAKGEISEDDYNRLKNRISG